MFWAAAGAVKKPSKAKTVERERNTARLVDGGAKVYRRTAERTMISRSRECQFRHDLEKAADDRFETTVHIVRNLALTACRRGEAINLRRDPSRVSDDSVFAAWRRPNHSLLRLGLDHFEGLSLQCYLRC